MSIPASVIRHPLTWILLLALLVRLPFAFIPSFSQPDEIFQYLEQAHRVATGYGIIPWEFDRGIRSWLIPLILSPPILLFDRLAIGGDGYVEAIRVLAVFLSLAVVIAFYRMGRAISPLHALVAGVVGATWFELVHFASHTLGESLSLAAFFPGAWLLSGNRNEPLWRTALAGFLLGLAVSLRFQNAPAVATLVLFGCGTRVRRSWFPVLAGGGAALLLGSAADLAMGAFPFEWAVRNLSVNIGEGVAAGFGTEGPLYYFGIMLAIWETSALIVLPLALLGARRYPALFLAGAVHLLVHTLIGHKEYRFILLSNAIFVLLAAFGFADALRWIARDLSDRRERALAAGGLAFWGLTSLILAAGEWYRYRWTENHPALTLTAEAGRLPGLCGVALRELPFIWTGGYSYLNRPVPIYEFLPGTDTGFRQSLPAFNAVMAPAGTTGIPDAYRKVDCAAPLGFSSGKPPSEGGGPMCLYLRPGPCAQSAAALGSRVRAQLMR